MLDIPIVRHVRERAVLVLTYCADVNRAEEMIVGRLALHDFISRIPTAVLERIEALEDPISGLIEGNTTSQRNESRDALIARVVGRDVMSEFERGETQKAVRSFLIALINFLEMFPFEPNVAETQLDKELKLRLFQFILFREVGEKYALPDEMLIPMAIVRKYATIGARGVAYASPDHFEKAVKILIGQ